MTSPLGQKVHTKQLPAAKRRTQPAVATHQPINHAATRLTPIICLGVLQPGNDGSRLLAARILLLLLLEFPLPSLFIGLALLATLLVGRFAKITISNSLPTLHFFVCSFQKIEFKYEFLVSFDSP